MYNVYVTCTTTTHQISESKISLMSDNDKDDNNNSLANVMFILRLRTLI